MLATILKAFTVPEIRKKLRLYHTAARPLPAGLPHPGAGGQHRTPSSQNPGQLLRSRTSSGVLNILLSAAGSSSVALFALGIMPYITASIILQLLTVVVPSLEKLSKEGEVGQAKKARSTRAT